MKMKLLSVAGALSLALGFISCEKANDPEYVVPAGNVNEVVLDNSIYTHQTFIDLSTNTVVATNSIDAWDLSIQTYGSDSAVYLNSSLSYYVYKTTSTNIDETITIPESITWLYDDQGGDAAKTAIGNWENGEVYFIGLKDLTNPDPTQQVVTAKYKISFEKTGTGIVVKWADITASTVTVSSTTLKYTNSNEPYTWFSFADGGKAAVQPPAIGDWDIEFTPYTANLGVPYLVNGVLTNRNGGVVSYKDPVTSGLTNEEYTAYFSALNTDSVQTDLYSAEAHTIGYSWKKSGVDSNGNPTGVYEIRPSYMYIVKDADGHQYKLRMTNFYKESEKGYVTFEYALLGSATK